MLPPSPVTCEDAPISRPSARSAITVNSERRIWASGLYVPSGYPVMSPYFCMDSRYPSAQCVAGTSLKEEAVRLWNGSTFSVRRRTAAASARVMKASGLNVPEVSPIMMPSLTMIWMYPDAQWVAGTSGKDGFVFDQPSPRARDSAVATSALETLRSGLNIPSG